MLVWYIYSPVLVLQSQVAELDPSLTSEDLDIVCESLRAFEAYDPTALFCGSDNVKLATLRLELRELDRYLNLKMPVQNMPELVGKLPAKLVHVKEKVEINIVRAVWILDGHSRVCPVRELNEMAEIVLPLYQSIHGIRAKPL